MERNEAAALSAQVKLSIDLHHNHPIQVNSSEILQIAQKIWEEEGEAEAQVAIIFVDDDFIRTLNRQYLKRESATDVLAFSLGEASSALLEGEIYISLDCVLDNARVYGVSFEAEVRRVVIHGLLHLLDYEDETKSGKSAMRRREDFYLEQWNRTLT